MKTYFISVVTFLTQFAFFADIQAQAIVINYNQTPTQLVQSLLGTGITATNVTGQISPVSVGSFTNSGVQGFTMPSGIILCTGELSQFYGVQGVFNSTDLGLPGDPDLDTIIAPIVTQDAMILEFDFTCASDSVEFEFLFSSEEYNDYANTSFTDIFSFFVTGPGFAPNTNVALLPGTTTPISINTVNNGLAAGTSSGPCMNCAYYVDNVNTNAVSLSHDGFTVPIKIKFPVWPCSNYHFKIAIADAADGAFDSQVILQGGSFQACPIMQLVQNNVPIPSLGTQYVCTGGSITLTAPPASNYQWSNGDTTQSIIVTQSGIYSMYASEGSCFVFSESVNVVQLGISIQTPVISQLGTSFISTVISAPGITYQWNLNGVPIPGATQSTLPISSNGCYTLTIYEGTCESTSNVECITSTALLELQANSISIYPNPVTGTSYIETPFAPGTKTQIELLDFTGRIISTSSQIQINNLKFEKGTLATGVYILKISNSDYEGAVFKKIIIH